jgi:SAM-dependent methyltransferase
VSRDGRGDDVCNPGRVQARLRYAVRHLRRRLRTDHRFRGHYDLWRERRVTAIVDHYGAEWFEGKTVLEVGCGYGDLGAHFLALGADVTFSDAREEHLREARRRHGGPTVCADLDRPWTFQPFDLVLHLGVLYHLADPERHLHDLLATRPARLVLETEVSRSLDPGGIIRNRESGYDQGVSGVGAHPSGPLVERVLREHEASFVEANGGCNSGIHVYDWTADGSEVWVPGERRMWFVKTSS